MLGFGKDVLGCYIEGSHDCLVGRGQISEEGVNYEDWIGVNQEGSGSEITCQKNLGWRIIY